MKDYHDLLLLVRDRELINLKRLKKAASNTFTNRGTPLSFIRFDDTGFEALQRLWTAHLRGLGDIAEELRLPKDIKAAIDEINSIAALLLG